MLPVSCNHNVFLFLVFIFIAGFSVYDVAEWVVTLGEGSNPLGGEGFFCFIFCNCFLINLKHTLFSVLFNVKWLIVNNLYVFCL